MKNIFTNSNESAVVRNGYRCAKVARPLRTVFLIGTLLLTLGVGQMWAEQMCDLVSSGDVNQRMPNYEAGYNMGSINVWFSINGASYSSKSSSASDINSNRAISASNITSGLKFNKFSVPVYCHNQNHSDACSNNGARIVDQSLVMSWKVSNPSGTQVGSGDFITTTNVSLSWSGNGATGTWTSNTSAKDLLSGVTASTTGNLTYTMDFWYKFCCHMYNSGGSDWGSNVNVWYPGNSQNFKYQFTIPQTTLTVNHSGDDGTATASSGISSSIALNTNYTLTASEVTGYDFVNWTTSDASITITSATSRTGAKVKFTSFTSATITANYTPKTTTVTLNANAPDGETVTGGGTTVTATYDATLPSFSALTCTGGYALKGYYDATSNGNKIINADGSFNGNSGIWNRTDGSTLTLYAQWSLDRTLTYDDNGSTGGSVPASPTNYSNGASATVLGNTNSLVKTGYTFTGWNTSADGNGTPYSAGNSITMNANYTLYAQWSENMTTVNLIASPTGRGTFTVGGSTVTSTTAGVTTTRSVTAVPITGYYLTGTIWSKNNNNISLSTTTSATTTVTGGGTAGTSTDLTATFKEKYLLCGSVNAAGNPSGGMRGWSTSGNNDSYSSVTYSGSTITIQANLTQAGTQYKCMIRDVQNSAWKGQTSAGGSMSDGDTWTWNGTNDVLFTTTEAGIYTFTINISGASPSVQLTYPGETEYSATLSVHSSGHGSVSPAAGSITLHPYTPTTIRATPEAGYRFKQWNTTGSVTCSNSTSATATFTASAASGTIEAEFTQEGIIYFDNTMSQWKGDIYVYFFSNNAWYDNVSDSKGPGMVPTVNSRGYGKMTRISSSNVYYFNYHEASITPTQYIGFTKGDHHTSNGVYQTSAAYLKNFDSCFPMYLASQNWTTTNATGYHNAGYWKRYNVTESGFDIRGLNSTWTADLHPFTSTTPNSNTFKTTVTLNNATHEFKIYRCYGDELGNNGKMTPVNHSGWEMTPGTNNCRIEAPSGGDYEFTLNLGSDHIYLSVEFPLLRDDYRLLYTGRITTDGSDSHKHPSQSIRHLTGNNKVQKDTISFWIDKDHQGTIQLQQCTNPAANGGKGSWSNITSVSYSGVTKTGIYNFVITQTTNGSGARTVTATPLSENFKYEDDLYIRTDASDGGWEAYKYVEDNKLEYSEWARDHSGYDYYHCYFAGTGCNVHFTIANKYSSSLTDTLTTDAIVTTGNLRYQCNVRFMYTSSSNKIGRAYLNGSSETGDNEFLVLQGASSGAQIKKKDGTALDGNKTKLDDNGNWIYSIDIKADETARVKLISNYRFDGFDHNQWFIGTSAAWSTASTEQILGGNTPSKSHLIRVIYDFKTNHLISAWLADGEEVDEVKAINTSVMIVREHQLDAEQITFSGGKLTEVGTVYCVMKFNKWTLNNKAKAEPHSALAQLLSPYERGLYWISFPFDVKLNDVFGFGQYGQHWIIEYYDGKTRAQKGFWAESPVNWKYVMPSEKDDYILKANVGYVLALDLDEMTESSHVWDYVEDVHLYFPSKDPVHNILQKNVSVDIDQDGYQCTINRTTEGLGPEYDRRIRDSYWHCIGVPSFANNAHTLKHDGWAEEDPDYPDLDDPEDDWTAASLPFYYAWNPETNALAPYSDGGSLTFKAMNSYLVQYSQATMSWTNVSTPSASIVARKKAKAEDIHFTEFKLELMKGEESMDYTFIRLTDNEEVTSGFEFGHDLCKEFNNGKANIYTFIEDLQVAGNSLPLESEKTTIVPVGVKTSAAGEYTFAMPEGTNGIGVTLVDNETGDRTNLAMSDYSVTLNTGTIDGRFVLEISPVAQTPTGMEEVTGDGLQVTGARKVMVDGVLYIVKEGKVFDARGTRCK